jgi:hypothetical protein
MKDGCAKRIAATAMLFSGLTLLASCSSPERDPAPVVTTTPPPPTSQPMAHWVQDSRLKALMGILANQTAAVPAQGADVETPPGFLKNQTFDQAATLAEGLSQTALMIPRIPGKAKLSEADRNGFDAEAGKLHDLAQELKAAAQAHRIERMQTTMETMSNTCTACHTRYRDLTGAFDPRAALD